VTGMPGPSPALLHTMDEEMAAPQAALREPEVPVLVSLGDEDVPVCEDGSCQL
jgi:hypothetical protein